MGRVVISALMGAIAVGGCANRRLEPIPRQLEPFEWKGVSVFLHQSVSEKDLDDLLELARLNGMADVEEIFIGSLGTFIPRMARVTNRGITHGDLIVQHELRVRHRDWFYTPPSDDEAGHWHGNWRVSPEPVSDVSRYIVRDGEWSTEVRFARGMTFECTEKIILAVRRNELIDARIDPLGGMNHTRTLSEAHNPVARIYPSLGPGSVHAQIKGVAQDDLYTLTLSPFGSSGTTLTLRVDNERVALVDVSIWIV